MNLKTIPAVIPEFPFEAYSHVVTPIDAAEGGGFMFTIPDIPGVVGDGESELEAIADGREAFVATVSAMVDRGQEVPAPTFNIDDFTPASASGRVLARLPRSMHRQLTARAKTEGVSLNSLVLAFIAEGLGRHGSARRP
jgi:antitoxin HicB